MTRSPRPSPSVFAFYKRSNTGGENGLGTRLFQEHIEGIWAVNIIFIGCGMLRKHVHEEEGERYAQRHLEGWSITALWWSTATLSNKKVPSEPCALDTHQIANLDGLQWGLQTTSACYCNSKPEYGQAHIPHHRKAAEFLQNTYTYTS